jgi:hypothetical protein
MGLSPAEFESANDVLMLYDRSPERIQAAMRPGILEL